jgi:hypothetical protein
LRLLLAVVECDYLLEGADLVLKQGLEGWSVEECEIVLQRQEQGRQRGLKEGLQYALLLTLEQRFSNPLPVDLAVHIQAQTDPEQLRRWVALAATASSLEHFRSATDFPGQGGKGSSPPSA